MTINALQRKTENAIRPPIKYYATWHSMILDGLIEAPSGFRAGRRRMDGLELGE